MTYFTVTEQSKLKVFKEIKFLLERHKGKLTAKKNMKSDYQLYSIKKIEVRNRIYDEIYFAGVTVKKNDVGFYFFPLYTHLKEFKLSVQLKNKLKGKTCFHLNKLVEDLKKEISLLVKKGYEVYKKAKWI